MDTQTTRENVRKVVEVRLDQHKALKHIATDRDVHLRVVTDEVIAAGLRVLSAQPATPAA